MRLIYAVIAISVCLTGCHPESPTPTAPAAPNADRVRADLPGVAFDFFEDADGPREWTIGADEIRSVAVADTAFREGGVRVRARVVLASPSRTIRGALDLDYRRDGAGWHLVGVQRAGPSWAVGDAEFVLYDVGAVPSDSLNPDRLSLDVIARFSDGAWSAPFDGVADRVGALFDSTMTDSLLTTALDAVADSVRQGWVPPGREVRVWAPGRSARAVTIDSADVSVDGCQFAVGWAAGVADENALGSTSSVFGSTPTRRLTGPETRALDRLAAQRLEVQGRDARRLRPTGALAADLDADGTAEIVGTYAVGDDALADGSPDVEGATAGIVVAARMASDGARLLFERVPDYASGLGAVSLVGVADLDADGAAEVVLREEGYEAFGYRIVTFRAGRFVDAFRGGGGGC